MSNETKTPRITKAMVFADLKAIVMGEEQPNHISADDLIARLDKEIENLSKKNAAKDGEKKPTETQKKNEGYKAEILTILASAPEEGMTCGAIHRLVNYEDVYDVQKTASLLRQLGPNGEGKVTSYKKSSKTYFKLA